MRWEVMDATNMDTIPDYSIDVIIDKSERMREAIYSPLATEAARGTRPQ